MFLIFYEKHQATCHFKRNDFTRGKEDHLYGNCEIAYRYEIKNSGNH